MPPAKRKESLTRQTETAGFSREAEVAGYAVTVSTSR